MNQPDGPAMNRAARRRAAREARVAGRPSPRPSAPQNANRAGEPYFMTINHGPDRRNVSCRKITGEQQTHQRRQRQLIPRARVGGTAKRAA